MCQALIGMHAFTGYDTVSAFAGKGKAKALKMLTHSKDYQDTFMELVGCVRVNKQAWAFHVQSLCS